MKTRRGSDTEVGRRMMATRMNPGFTLNRDTEVLATITIEGPDEIGVSVSGQHKVWLPKVLQVAEESIRKMIGITVHPDVLDGKVEIGVYSTQEAWSDDSYIAVWSDNPKLAKGLIGIVAKYVPLTGGGVPGSYYRGSGQISGKDNQYSFHYSSFGIGD